MADRLIYINLHQILSSTMHISLHHYRAMIGGATSGLGKAIAMQLAASGASVTLVARDEAKLQKVLTTLPPNDTRPHDYVVVDFYQFDALQKIMHNYFLENSIDILVNNTNGPKAGNVLAQEAADYQSAFNLLFQNVAYTTQQALPYMQQKGYGRIINLTSRTVQEPAENLTLSNVMRSALTAWAKTLSSSVAANNITVNNILTGNFYTERLISLMNGIAQEKKITFEQTKAEMEQAIPAQRFGSPEEMAYLVTFLASPQAGYINGTNITIDGGLMKSL